jgi:vacuolar protein sorting-associated protein 13A/C
VLIGKFLNGSKVNQRPKVVAIDIRADGHMQILRITPYRPERSKYKPRRRSGSTLVTRTESMSSTSDIFEAVPEQVSTSATYVIDFVGIGMSVIDKKLVEVLYVTIGDLKFEYATSPVTQSINLSCGTLQVDNQLHDALFSVVLQPTPIPKSSPGVAPLPTIQTSLIWLNDNGRLPYDLNEISI